MIFFIAKNIKFKKMNKIKNFYEKFFFHIFE